MDIDKLKNIKHNLITQMTTTNISRVFSTVLFINLILSVIVFSLNVYLNTTPQGILELFCGVDGILLTIFLFFDNNCADISGLSWTMVPFLISSISLAFVALMPLINGGLEWKYGKAINGIAFGVIVMDTIFVIISNMMH